MARSRKDKSGSKSEGTWPSRKDAAAHGSPSQGWRAWFAEKRIVIRSVGVFLVVMCLFYAIDYTPLPDSEAFERYLGLTARMSGWVLNLFGQEVTSNGVVLQSPGFSVRIARGCDALEPTAAFMAAVLASPVAFRRKLAGLVIGIACLLTINLIRIASLFFVGVHFPQAFDLMHYELWQGAFVVLAIALWAVWVQWATRRQVQTQ